MSSFDDEMNFRAWYVPLAMKLGIAPNPDDVEHHYDYRRFFQDMKAGKVISPDRPGGHFPSTYKLSGHPRKYLDDGLGRMFDTQSAQYFDGSPVPDRNLRASEPGLASMLIGSLKGFTR
jgi:hypothetical protein